MKYVVAGTAGHIDHGKTSLVRALTGIDTDRLKEEKQRGISIDLGFAHLALSAQLRLAIVDVPGHERFIRNMLAGVGGIDFIMLVVAADESIKPQTREHFDICRLLGITRGMVVLTKSDLVDSEILELVKLEVEDFTRGSFLDGAPVVAVSSITGMGVHELRQSLATIGAEVPARSAQRYFRLALDRSFSIRGFGTVVTGTVSEGAVSSGQDVQVFPGGQRLRVRGIETHGENVEQAGAGQRAALNLAGVEASDLHRGMALAEPGRFAATKSIDCTFRLLPGAKALKNRAPIHFHASTAEVEAVIRRLNGSFARIQLREPVLMLPGDRFIVRSFSPVVTIGGGEVLDIAPPRKAGVDRLTKLAQGGAAERIELLVTEARFGLSIASLVARTGLIEAEIRKSSGSLKSIGDWFVSAEWFEARSRAIEAALRDFHRLKPLLAGMPKEELRARICPGAPAFVFEALLNETRTLVADGETVRLASHKVALQDNEEAAARKIEAAFQRAGLAVPAMAEVLAGSGVEVSKARTLLQMLLKQQLLVRVSEDLVFHKTALDRLRELLAPKKGTRFQVGEFKDWTGISRKYAIPLLEFLDRQRITRREGEGRVVL